MVFSRPPPLALRPVPWTFGGLVAVAAVVAVLWPLATYSTTLALFGPAHVMSELRYLRRRFGGWLAGYLLPIYALLAAVAALRAAALFNVVPRAWISPIELGLGVLLVVAVWPRAARSWRSGLAGLTIAVVLVVGLLWAPVHTLLAVAVLHNWTPVPLIGEALGPNRAWRWAGIVTFAVIPALIASGLPFALAGPFAAPEWTVLDAGPLSHAYGAYLWPEIARTNAAQHVFSAVVFAQCLHYISVIGILPRLGPPAHADGRGPVGVLLIGTAVLLALYALDFTYARQVYGVFAAVHAWVEVPILVLALLPPYTTRQAGCSAPSDGASMSPFSAAPSSLSGSHR